MSKRLLLTLITILIIGLGALVAIYFAKGYRFSLKNGTILGTGIMSITSEPDQASVYLDGHLTTATNENINNLLPKSYEVKIVKEGYIAWQKKVEVKQGLVSQVRASLFRAIPSVYPLTYSGAVNATLSPDGEKLAFVVPTSDEQNPVINRKKSGLWVWTMKQNQITFARGGEPRQIAVSDGIDYTQAKLRFSPDSSQVLASFEDRHLLLDTGRLNDPARDITPTMEITLRNWDQDQRSKDLTRLQLLKDRDLRETASASAKLLWSPDETKILYSKDGKKDFQVVDLVEDKTYNLPDANYISWLPAPDNKIVDHLVIVESEELEGTKENEGGIRTGKISVIEFDGSNRAEIFAGNFDPDSVFAWPDGSRLLIISSFPTPTASKPNLYGVNLK